MNRLKHKKSYNLILRVDYRVHKQQKYFLPCLMKTFSIKGISKLLCVNEYSQCDYIVSYGVSEEGKEHIKVVFDKIIQKTHCTCLQYHEKHLLYAGHKMHTCTAADSSMNGTSVVDFLTPFTLMVCLSQIRMGPKY